MREFLLFHILIISSIFLLTPIIHSAEEEKDRLLVVPLKAKKGIHQDEATLLTDVLSVEIYKSHIFTILNRDDMKAVLTEKEFEIAMGCDDNICLLQNVAKLTVNKLIAGDIGKLGNKYIVSIRLINEDGENEIMEITSCNCAIEELDRLMKRTAFKILRFLDKNLTQYGIIWVSSEPSDATLFFDGHKLGTTPDLIRNIKPGIHEVEVRKNGYKKWSKRLKIEQNRETTLTVSLQKKTDSKSVKSGPALEEKYIDQITGMEFVRIKGGCFDIGDTFGNGDDDEKPVHEVCVDDFYIGKHEVTVGEFRIFIHATGYKTEAETNGGMYSWVVGSWKRDKEGYWDNPGFAQTDRHPVVGVSWNDVQEFVRWIKSKTGLNYRLPTESEWEYTARSGGKNYMYSWGDNKPSGNVADKTLKKERFFWKIWKGHNDGYAYTSPVGSFKSNALGIYDMTGNVCEWCSDVYDGYYYERSRRINPQGPHDGQFRVYRGGGWYNVQADLRSSRRRYSSPKYKSNHIGFRIARTP